MRVLLKCMIGAALALTASPAWAQASYPTAAGNVRVQGVVPLQCDSSGANCAPAGTANPGAVQGNVASGATDSGFPVKVGGKYNFTLPLLTDGQRSDVQTDLNGNTRVRLVGRAATGYDSVTNNTISIDGPAEQGTTVRLLVVGPHVFNGTTWDREKKAAAASTVRILSAAASTNSTLIKGSAGDMFALQGQNVKAAPVYLKLYNKATAPTCGTDTPVMTFYLPASSAFNLSWPTSLYFSTGMGLCLTGAAADADATALVAGDVVALNALIQ